MAGMRGCRRGSFQATWRQPLMENAMGYMLLIVEPRGQREARTRDEGLAAWDVMMRFAGGLQARGLLKAAESLKKDEDATRVQIRGGKSTLIDGPFAEAK